MKGTKPVQCNLSSCIDTKIYRNKQKNKIKIRSRSTRGLWENDKLRKKRMAHLIMTITSPWHKTLAIFTSKYYAKHIRAVFKCIVVQGLKQLFTCIYLLSSHPWPLASCMVRYCRRLPCPFKDSGTGLHLHAKIERRRESMNFRRRTWLPARAKEGKNSGSGRREEERAENYLFHPQKQKAKTMVGRPQSSRLD